MQVKYENCISERNTIEYSVPQGRILGPLLFILLINDLNNVLKYSKSIIFADDTTIYLSGRAPMMLYAQAKHDLMCLSEWFKANKLTLNLEKSEYILFRKPASILDLNRYTLKRGDVTIKRVSVTKFLGVCIDEYLKWNEHAVTVINKLKSVKFLLQKLHNLLPTSSLKTIYYANFHGHLIYGIVNWGVCVLLNIKIK